MANAFRHVIPFISDCWIDARNSVKVISARQRHSEHISGDDDIFKLTYIVIGIRSGVV